MVRTLFPPGLAGQPEPTDNKATRGQGHNKVWAPNTATTTNVSVFARFMSALPAPYGMQQCVRSCSQMSAGVCSTTAIGQTTTARTSCEQFHDFDVAFLARNIQRCRPVG